jgi:hypothetical protein
MRASLIGLAAGLFVLAASAAPHIEKLSVDDGLPSSYPREVVRSPNGVIWATMMAAQGTERIGLVRVENGAAKWLHGPESGLGSDRVAAITADAAGGLWAATDVGLFRTDTTGPAHFSAVGEAMPLRWLGAVPGGGVWAASDDLPGARTLLLATAGQARRVSLPDTCPQVLGLHPTALHSGIVVCKSSLIRIVDGVAQRVGTSGAPVEIPKADRARGERRQPLVWLYDAAPAPDGLWLVGHTKRLTHLGAGGFQALATGHFAEFARGSSQTAVVCDFDGGIFQLTGGALRPVAHESGGVGRMWVDDSASAVWAVISPEGAAARVERLPLTDAGPKTLHWSLGESAGRPSPGVVGLTGDGAGGVWLATNEGLWHLVQ